MPSLSRFTLALLSATAMNAALAQTPAPAAEVYLAQAAASDPQLAAEFARLTAPVAGASGWVAQYGTAGPATQVQIDNRNYLLFQGCQPHNCPAQSYVALYSPAERKMVAGAFVANRYNMQQQIMDSRITWLGAPDYDMVVQLGKFLY